MSSRHVPLPRLLMLSLLLLPCCFTATKAQEQTLRVMEMNVENLFDTLHDEGKDDAEFLPGAARQWDGHKYWRKLGKLARLFAAAGGLTPIDLIGLCEVENDSVLTDLTQRTLLHRLGYDYIITHSPDLRGVDVALLYQPLRFQPFHTEEIVIPHHPTRERPTRNVLHVGGVLTSGDTLDVYVCHLPSRSGGRKQTDDYRLRAATIVRESVDSIFRRRADAAVIVMGDFNDEARNRSLKQGLRARKPEDAFCSTDLVDLSERYTHPDVRGTYKFRGQWNQLDHILVSGALLQKTTGLRTSADGCEVLTFPFLLEKDGSRGVKPRRTYLGTYYHAGISDHLPLRLTLRYTP